MPKDLLSWLALPRSMDGIFRWQPLRASGARAALFVRNFSMILRKPLKAAKSKTCYWYQLLSNVCGLRRKACAKSWLKPQWLGCRFLLWHLRSTILTALPSRSEPQMSFRDSVISLARMALSALIRKATFTDRGALNPPVEKPPSGGFFLSLRSPANHVLQNGWSPHLPAGVVAVSGR